MKITVGELKRTIREAISDDERYMSRDDAEKFIESQDPDDVAKFDVIDEDTGEVYIERGEPFHASWFHPVAVALRQKDHDEKVAARDAEKAQWAKEDEEWEDDQQRKRQELEAAWHHAIDEYASQWESFVQENPGTSPEDAAPDAAEGFFSQYPQWRDWSRALDMPRHHMKEAIVDYVYNAMMMKRAF